MVMIPTPGSRVQSSETGGPRPVQQSPHVPETQTSSQPPPTPDTDVADEDAEAAASATADTRPLLIWDGHDCWDQVKKGTTEITNVFKEHYKWYAPLFSHAPDEAIDFWWEEWRAMRRANKTNRASSTGGSLHTGGSITYPATAKKMAIELGRPPTQSEVFVQTHTKKKKIREAVKAEVKRLEDERDARIAAGLPPGPPINEDEVWDRMAGSRKKDRIYGKGKVPKRPAPRLVDPEDAST
ncbi:hypothetical protein PIB30_049686 [Stylosanthes scabra]|uniref:Uncharacterized protein n=1 Tax=Stylosanthes scabra TaxID=79078 RepID=A0ABU6XFU1_9FABA|nr:hypothetical protein [Stylosanthes scabra]